MIDSQPYTTVDVSSPLDNPDHTISEVNYRTQLERTTLPPPRTEWHYKPADYKGLRANFSASPWDVT